MQAVATISHVLMRLNVVIKPVLYTCQSAKKQSVTQSL